MNPYYRLHPAYRSGQETPWGGDALARLFGKKIPEVPTGESLEASTLPGLESTLDDGRTLTELVGGRLPLLLKLLDARQALSVQVHPDDAYAAAHEGGKLGKTEAWLILHAAPGAKLVYGLQRGTDVHALTPEAIERHLRWVPARAGDAFYIPAGMVHAIGPGIVLYEIQQSSDVTYRFWDWGRMDRAGNPRPLHWKQACDVARPDLQLMPTRGTMEAAEGGQRVRLLDTPFFTLERIGARTAMPLPPAKGFQLLTALGDGALRHPDLAMQVRRGETFYIPPGVRDLSIEGPVDVVISAEKRP